MTSFSPTRFLAVLAKEFTQMRRDRLTFGMIVMLPIVQILLFGYAINSDPRHMPAIVEMRDTGRMARSLVAALEASSFFDIIALADSPEAADAYVRSGRAAFLIAIPEGFEARLLRGERPEILVAADATDPVAASGALTALPSIVERAFARDLDRAPMHLRGSPPPYAIVAHPRYNPAGISAYNIVPGLLGIVLTMTLVMITSMALTREAERGTLETLLSTPVRPMEVMLGKTVPYLFVAAIQTGLIMAAALALFRVPFSGDAATLMGGIVLFVMVNLILGFLISTAARSQMQAMQMTIFIFLPSILLSGFMFPFSAMPAWAQVIGNALPTTHFIRIVRKVMLKGADFTDVAGDVWPLGAMLLVLGTLALMRYRRTLD